jgi:hypothetical protein
MSRALPKALKATVPALICGALVIMLTASQALAAGTVSNSSANAIGGNVINTGACVSANSGGAQTQSAVAGTGALLNLSLGCTVGGGPTQQGALVAASNAVQTGHADATGSSTACGGVTGVGGGAIQVGPSNPCTGINPGTGSGVTALNSLVSATALYSICAITNGGTPTATPTVVGLSIGGPLLTTLQGLGLGAVTGAGSILNPTPTAGGTTNTLALGGVPLLSITLNNVTTAAGVITATAFDLKVLPGLVNLGGVTLGLLGLTGLTSGLEVIIGTVSCGPNAVVPTTSALPTKALPIAGGVLVLAGGAAYLGRRQLFSAFRG